MKEGYKLVESIKVASDYEALLEVESLIDKICEKLSVKEENYGNILIAVTEAFNNAIKHGNKMNGNLKVEISVSEGTSDFCFSIIDEGNGFDYKKLPDPTAPENIEKENGRGIFLMKSLSDIVEFTDNGRRVNLYFSK